MGTHPPRFPGCAARIAVLVCATCMFPAPPRDVDAADVSSTTPQIWNPKGRVDGSVISAKFSRQAQRAVQKADRNGDGVLDKDEWKTISPDLDKNMGKLDGEPQGVVTVEELAAYLARYARQHTLQTEDTAWQRLPQPPSAIFTPVTSSKTTPKKTTKGKVGEASDAEDSSDADNHAARQDGSDGDANDDDSASGGKPSKRSKAAASKRSSKKFHVADAALPGGLPDWFFDRDGDGDGQLTLGEFAPDGSQAQRDAFKRQDSDGDGVLTPEEISGAATNETEQKPSTGKEAKEEDAP